MKNKRFLEITTKIGCPVNCLQYCPQEVTIKKYGRSEKTMSFENFKKILYHVPKDVVICFSGFCEPLANPSFLDMAEYAHKQGYLIELNTTLHSLQKTDIDKLAGIPYYHFCLHLPDGKAMKEPPAPYREVLVDVLTKIPNIVTMSMHSNGIFKTNNRENVTRGIRPTRKRFGWCPHFEKEIRPIVNPDGKTYLCCMDFGLEHCVGNLLKESYEIVALRIKENKGMFSLCQYCCENVKYTTHIAKQTLEKCAHGYRRLFDPHPKPSQ